MFGIVRMSSGLMNVPPRSINAWSQQVEGDTKKFRFTHPVLGVERRESLGVECSPRRASIGNTHRRSWMNLTLRVKYIGPLLETPAVKFILMTV